jgi:hypothetical protein
MHCLSKSQFPSHFKIKDCLPTMKKMLFMEDNWLRFSQVGFIFYLNL